jgi:hypothetical protein
VGRGLRFGRPTRRHPLIDDWFADASSPIIWGAAWKQLHQKLLRIGRCCLRSGEGQHQKPSRSSISDILSVKRFFRQRGLFLDVVQPPHLCFGLVVVTSSSRLKHRVISVAFNGAQLTLRNANEVAKFLGALRRIRKRARARKRRLRWVSGGGGDDLRSRPLEIREYQEDRNSRYKQERPANGSGMSESDREIPKRWRKAAERARKALEKAKIKRELGLKRPALTAAGGHHAAQFKRDRRFRNG